MAQITEAITVVVAAAADSLNCVQLIFICQEIQKGPSMIVDQIYTASNGCSAK